jgi:hypothetical protein
MKTKANLGLFWGYLIAFWVVELMFRMKEKLR